MSLAFPSRAFDEAVASVCHGSASEEQLRGLNRLLRADPAARDEYILRVELHARLASEPDLFLGAEEGATEPAWPGCGITLPPPPPSPPPESPARFPGHGGRWLLAAAACVALLAAGAWGMRWRQPGGSRGTTSMAVALLNRTVEAQWEQREQRESVPRPGAPLEPGWLHLKSGLAQIVFYSGARVGIEGPADLQLVSPNEAACRSGRLIAEVPPQAKGFRVRTPQLSVTDLGTSFGLEAGARRTEVHVFKGSVEFQPAAGMKPGATSGATSGAAPQALPEGAGAVAEDSGPPRRIAVNPAAFASLFELQLKSSAADVLRHEEWRAAGSRLDEDPSLLVHFDFEQAGLADWRLANTRAGKNSGADATLVGCQWSEGRWPDKRALEFRGVSDRVRLSVPGDYDSLTLAAWVRVQGLDRQINSLLMSDGFEAGTVHWSIRHDGVLALTAIGAEAGDYQICTSPPVLTLDQFGLWVHLAVVIDGGSKQIAHYLNGVLVGGKALAIQPPFHVGVAELGNWNAKGFPRNDPFMIRNFSGGMDEFSLFGRALSAGEIRAMYSAGKPQPDPLRSTRR